MRKWVTLMTLFYKIRNKLTAIKPAYAEVTVFDDPGKQPLRVIHHVIKCPKCGTAHLTDRMPYLNCSCGFNAQIDYSKEIKVEGLQDTINHLLIRINYMIITREEKEIILPFLAELRELSDALEFGTTYEDIKEQKWKSSPLGLKHEIMGSLR